MISVHNIQKSFKTNHVLQGLDFTARKGAITSILGPNGSGKTTLIKCILGLNNLDKGEITINGQNIRKGWNYRRDIAYLPQMSRFPENLKIKDLIDMIKDVRGQEGREEHLFELFDLKKHFKTPLSRLSGGTRQKVNIVLAFMFDAPLIILDEPTIGLDPVSMIRLKDLILEEKARGKTILITTHILELVEELTDELIFILEGKIYFQGTLEEMEEKTGEHKLERSIAQILLKDEAAHKAAPQLKIA